MHPDLDKLIHLQHAESELKRAESALAELPRRREAAEKALAEQRQRLEAAREAMDGSLKARRRYEGELQDLETKRSKYKGQLMDVKTNKEYTAMLHEIESVEREIRGREDLVLAEMEKAEGLGAEIKREEEIFKGAEEAARRELQQIEAEGKAQQEEAGRLVAERDRIAASLPGEALALFQRVAKLRGVAVAEVREGTCLLCHTRLRPQMFVELRRNDQIQQCPACSRILYYVPTAPTVTP